MEEIIKVGEVLTEEKQEELQKYVESQKSKMADKIYEDVIRYSENARKMYR